MKLGVFAKTFARRTVEEAFEAVAAHGLTAVQFNFTVCGLPTLPEAIPDELLCRVRQATERNRLEIAAVSGTFNLIHPRREVWEEGLQRLPSLLHAARTLGAKVVTLCAGTRDPNDPWRWHHDNDRPEAWADLTAHLGQALAMAETAGITLGIEPEVGNVIDSAQKAHRLLQEMRSPRLGIIMDGANLFKAGSLPRMREILTGAFDWLGGRIVLAHAKDLSRDGHAGHEAAGTGLLDYDLYLRLLHQAGYAGPLVLHSLTEAQVPASIAFLRQKLAIAMSDPCPSSTTTN